MMKAEIPARKLNAGAQKCVIHLVKKIGSVDFSGSSGEKKYELQ